MNNKKQKIIEAAIHMFAAKGFHATTIQDIADEAGIAKGGLYFYFKSKEDLLLAAYKHYYDLLWGGLSARESRSASPREALVEQLHSQFEQVKRHRSFLLMLMKEQTIKLDTEMQKFIIEMQMKVSEQFRKLLLRVYGERLEEHSHDMVICLRGIAREYTGLLITDHSPFHLRSIAEYVVKRLDDIARGLLQEPGEPIVNDEVVKRMMESWGLGESGLKKQKALEAARAYAEALNGINMNGDVPLAKWQTALEEMKKELDKSEPKTIIVEGLLTVLKPDGAGELLGKWEQLRKALGENGYT